MGSMGPMGSGEGVGGEVEPKPRRPLSWGERVEQRRQRRRAGVPASIRRMIGRVLGRIARFARSVGMTRGKVVVDGVVYRERNTTSLRRALSATGSGVKEYDVSFPHRGGAMQGTQYPMRESLRIRYTHKRIFSDLGHDPRLRFIGLIEQHIRPGDRVLEIGCGTGGGSDRLARLVGPSGAVVAIHRDGESIRFARQRYRHNHLGFEIGWLETLEGELDGSFDAVVAVDLFRDAPDEPSKSRAIGLVWRLVREGGVVVVICTDRHRLDQKTERLAGLGIESFEVFEPDPVLLWGGGFGIKPKGQ